MTYAAGYATGFWRLRGRALLASACLVAALCIVLYWASRQSAFDEGLSARGVEVLIEARPQPSTPPRSREATSRAPPTQTPQAAPAEDRDHAVLAQMLACFGPRRYEPARHCPPAPTRPPEWRTRDRLAVGGDFAQPEPLNLNSAFSRAEQATLVMPPCEGACMHITPPPPPPSRTAEEICERGGIGPCHPPPLREAAP